MPTVENAGAIRILVADDDPSLRLALTMVFERRGHAVIAAGDTDAARRVLAAEGADVALIDAGMPRDGVSFWRECGAAGSSLSGALLITGDIWALGDLADHPMVWEKPFDFQALVARVEELAGRTAPETQPPGLPG